MFPVSQIQQLFPTRLLNKQLRASHMSLVDRAGPVSEISSYH